MESYDYSQLAEHYDELELDYEHDEFNKILSKILKKFKVKTVLDVACGTGLQAIYLNSKNFKVTASDYNPEMIKIAQKKTKNLKFLQGDMKTINYGKFDAVISIYNVIGHLTKKEFEEALINISNSLKDNGLYIFDINNLEYLKNNLPDYEYIDVADRVNGIKYVRFNKDKLDRKGAVLYTTHKTYVQKNMEKPKVYNEKCRLQIYSAEQLKEILNKTGFEIINLLNINGKSFNSQTDLNIVAIARKK